MPPNLKIGYFGSWGSLVLSVPQHDSVSPPDRTPAPPPRFVTLAAGSGVPKGGWEFERLPISALEGRKRCSALRVHRWLPLPPERRRVPGSEPPLLPPLGSPPPPPLPLLGGKSLQSWGLSWRTQQRLEPKGNQLEKELVLRLLRNLQGKIHTYCVCVCFKL